MPDATGPGDTRDGDYAERLRRLESVWWKRLLDVQAPYRWNLRRYDLGRTLDVGCGIGRNLGALPPGSVGVDHNPDSVALARSRGLTAFTATAFHEGELAVEGAFDALLLAHVVEHMESADAERLLDEYLPYLRPGGRVLIICPQERGYTTDRTHVRFFDGSDLTDLARSAGLRPERPRSFPFPRRAGGLFTYNETCLLATRP